MVVPEKLTTEDTEDSSVPSVYLCGEFFFQSGSPSTRLAMMFS